VFVFCHTFSIFPFFHFLNSDFGAPTKFSILFSNLEFLRLFVWYLFFSIRKKILKISKSENKIENFAGAPAVFFFAAVPSQ